MTNLREAAQMALEALEYDTRPETEYGINVAIESLRAALAQPDAVINGMPAYEGSLSKSQRLAQSDHSEDTLEMVAQPKPEPVAWITDGGKGELWWYQSAKFDADGNLIGENPDDIPLYTAPPQREWQGLTDEEIREVLLATGGWRETIRAIEAKLKEKNG